MDQALSQDRPNISNSTNSSPRENARNIWLISLYFIIRIPVIFFLSADPSRAHWQFVSVYLAFYIIIAALIWNNRRNLGAFHLDRLSLYFFILFGSFFRVRGIDNLVTLSLEALLFLFAVCFGVILIKSKTQAHFPPVTHIWNGIAFFAGFGVAFFLLIIDPNKGIGSFHNYSMDILIGYFLKYLFTEIGASAIIEEPIYRGFLWGTLRNMGWQDNKIFWFQAFLFWMSHFDFRNDPFYFWVAAPIVSLLFGYLAWKSKSILPPMIAHAIYNAIQSTYLITLP